jgi:SAM-dependent methyltransferase
MSFDRLARHYSWLEWVLAGQRLQSCRTAFLPQAIGARTIMLAGEGHGRFLSELCLANRMASICCLDASAKMICVAKQRLKRIGVQSKRVDFHAVPLLDFEPVETFDLVVTQFFLDCFDEPELERVVAKLSAKLNPGGKWIIADFQVPPAGWRSYRARAILALAYGFFRAVTQLRATCIIDPAPYLVRERLRKVNRKEFNFGLLYAELWEKPVI